MKLTFLGTGTSEGVPALACDCEVCRDARRPGSKNNRKRTSILLEKNGRRIVVDTGPDFREQMLEAGVDRLDAVLYTHSHADHIAGIADLRAFSRKPTMPIPHYEKAVPVYTSRWVADYIDSHLPFVETGHFPFCDVHVLSPFEEVDIAGFKVTALPLWHGGQAGFIYGYAIDGLVYLTDVKTIPGSPWKDPDYPMPDCGWDTWGWLLAHPGRTLVIDALEHEHLWHGSVGGNPTHLTLEEDLRIVPLLHERISYTIHMNHGLSHEELSGPHYQRLSLFPSYDGLTIEVPDV